MASTKVIGPNPLAGSNAFRHFKLCYFVCLLRRATTPLILTIDPALKSERGTALRCLLYLFERDDAIRLTDAG